MAARLPFVVVTPNGPDRLNSHRFLVGRFANLDVVGVYFPNLEAKRPVFERLAIHVAPTLGPHGVVIGDFNTGLPFEDDVVNTFSCVDCF
jgi:hypothetical protein